MTSKIPFLNGMASIGEWNSQMLDAIGIDVKSEMPKFLRFYFYSTYSSGGDADCDVTPVI